MSINNVTGVAVTLIKHKNPNEFRLNFSLTLIGKQTVEPNQLATTQ